MTSKTKENLNNIAAIEKAMAKKFGKETIPNPKSLRTDEKEKEYLEELKEFYLKKRKKTEDTQKIDEHGFLLAKNLITKKSKRGCPVCEIYSFDMRDDLYMNKFECCRQCYIQWVEHREERWLAGWRPSDEDNEKTT